MAHPIMWYFTQLPSEITSLIEKDLEGLDPFLEKSTVIGSNEDTLIRNSENTWLTSCSWIAGYLWYFIDRANKTNFLYDISGIDKESIQYTSYGKGQYYGWHSDDSLLLHHTKEQISYRGVDEDRSKQKSLLGDELVRKISFSLQLSGPEEYKGGQFQIIEGEKMSFAPKQRGTLIIFDSRIRHRVLPVKEGIRKSLVGWVIGPRWK